MTSNHNNSFWYEAYLAPSRQRPALTNDRSVNMAIIGAGYTGLGSAYCLKRLQPTLNAAIIEARSIGFGTSERNGGWGSGFLTEVEIN